MTNLELITVLRESTFTNEDGEDYQLEFEPALTAQELQECAKRFPNGSIDSEVEEILKVTKGWDRAWPEAVYFDSVNEFGFAELLPYSVTLGTDGLGNSWVLDLDSAGNAGKVFFACHDPAVLIVHSQNITEYLIHLLDSYRNPGACHVNNVQDHIIYDVWKHDRCTSKKSDFLAAHPHYHEFLSQFSGEEWSVADLRGGQNKAGFAWGRYDATNLTQRHPTEMLWVMKNNKRGFLNRLMDKK